MTDIVRPLLAAMLGCVLVTTATAQPPRDMSPAEMIKRADTDGDGTLSLDEFIKARTARLEENFKRMDTNGDGKLDPQEAEAAGEKVRAMAAGGRPGGRRPEGPGPQRPGNAGRPERGDRGPAEGFRRPPQQN